MLRIRSALVALTVGGSLLLPAPASAEGFITTCKKGDGNWAYRPELGYRFDIEQARMLVHGDKACPGLRWDLLPLASRGSGPTVVRENFAYFIKKGSDITKGNYAKCLSNGGGAIAKKGIYKDAAYRVVIAKSSDTKRWDEWAEQLYVKYSLLDAAKDAVVHGDTTDLKAYAKQNAGAFVIDQAGSNILMPLIMEGAVLGSVSVAGFTLSIGPATVVSAGMFALKFAWEHTCEGKFEKVRAKLLTKYFRDAAKVPDSGAIVYSLSTAREPSSSGAQYRIYEEVDAILETPDGTISIPISGARSKLLFE